MYILILIVLVLIAGLILKIVWPLILAVILFLAGCFVLSILKERKERKKEEENVIDASYTVREDISNDKESGK